MKHTVKIAAIMGIVALEIGAMALNLNGETVIYALGALAALGGAETLETVRGG